MNADDKTIPELQAQIDDLKSENEQLKESISEVEADQEKSEQKIVTLQYENAALKSQIASIEDRLRRIR